MKKFIYSSLFVLGLSTAAFAQSSQTIGLRFGSNNGLGTEVSYQRPLGEANRLEANLGWRSSDNLNAIKVSGLYQWVWDLDENFNWYAGVGGGLLNWNHEKAGVSHSGTFVYGAGDIGIEYNFDFPLTISADFRPEFGAKNDYYKSYNSDIAIAFRYRF
ncbi:MAG: hypothetical protein RLZ77_1640 [Bacteroidota bacterium]|jgi:hypothetical protein